MLSLIPMMNEQALEDNIMEVKEYFMLSTVGDSESTLRTTHLLKPIADSMMKQFLKESKLILERKQLSNMNEGHNYTSIWMDMFNDKGSEIENLLINTNIDVVSNQHTQFFAMDIFLIGTFKK
jgi:hypothetical protein